MRNVFILILLVAGFSSYGRIGETEQQAIQRYGEIRSQTMTPAGNRSLGFEKEKILIGLDFFQDRCYKIKFTSRFGSTFSDDMIQGFLKANSGGMKWQQTEKNKWTRDDKLLTASLSEKGYDFFIINSKDENAKKKSEDDKRKSATKEF